MRVLVTAASKYGATAEIAEAIGSALTEHGLEVTVTPALNVRDVAGYDAVVVGSAVYAGHWMEAAKELVIRNADVLSAKPVWLFSSGPIGDPPKPTEDPVDVAGLVHACGAREHRVFAGRLERRNLGWGERAIAVALRAPEGDFRDFAGIRGWAAQIADSLRAGVGA